MRVFKLMVPCIYASRQRHQWKMRWTEVLKGDIPVSTTKEDIPNEEYCIKYIVKRFVTL